MLPLIMKSLPRWFCGLMFACFLSLAQSQTMENGRWDGHTPVTVEGNVRFLGASDEPKPDPSGVTVTLSLLESGHAKKQQTESRQTVTDSKGKFTFENVAAFFEVTATRPGYVELPRGLPQRAGEFPVDERIYRDITLGRAAVVQGNVQGTTSAISGAKITATPDDNRYGAAMLGSTEADEAGQFQLILPREFPVFLTLEAPGRDYCVTGPYTFDSPTSSVHLQFPRPAAISGRVLDETGLPIQSAQTVIFRQHERGFLRSNGSNAPGGRSAPVASDGSFRMSDVPPGLLMVHAICEGYCRSEIRDLSLSPGEERDDLEFRLEPGHILAGRVIDPWGNGVAHADVMATNVGARYYHRTTTDREGGFLVDELSSASVQLEILATSYSALRRTVPVDTTCVLVLGANDRVLIGNVVDAVTSRPIEQFEVYMGKGAIKGDPLLKPNQFRLEKISKDNSTELSLIRAPGYIPRINVELHPPAGRGVYEETFALMPAPGKN